MPGDESARDGADRRRDLQRDGDAEVCEAAADIRRGGAAAGGDDGDDAGADRVTDGKADNQGKSRDDDNSAAESEQRPDDARTEDR